MRLTASHTRNWLNSIHFHALALCVAVIAAMIAISLSVMYVIYEPSPRVSVYEMARLVHGLPLVRDSGPFIVGYQTQPMAGTPTRAEREVARALAEKLGMLPASVRVNLADIDQSRAVQFENEQQMYGREGANVALLGPFRIAIASGAGWKTVTRISGSNIRFWKTPGRYVMLGAFLLIIPLSYWFSRRLTRSIRQFAKSADELQAGRRASPVPVAGPTEIRLAASAINEMQSRIGRFVQERATLAAAIAHDLRAPLARVEFHLLEAEPSVRTKVEAEIREMEAMIATIMEFVEQDTKQIEPEPLDLAMLVEGVSTDFQDRGEPVIIGELQPAVVYGDPLLLRRLVRNIIENAIIYGREAMVSLTNGIGRSVVEVTDKGPGMTADELNRAFEPFFRGEPSRNRMTGGVGLGLAIVKSAADIHGATVKLSNVPGGGLSVRISMPSGTESRR